ncbi:centrosomal protein of 164 kDa [Prorops nasuta]|uniref:centrosomal protein of 164 kDa n=1 Tax=Prorops nasuta TaxID=863751 RepID=UPI0034CD127E
MSISQDSAATLVCKEVFDETSQPTEEEVLDYARRLEIDPDAEPHLLDLARQGLMAALPKGWVPCLIEATNKCYYYNATTGSTSWEHPLDAVYKDLVKNARAKARQESLERDAKTTIGKDSESSEKSPLPEDASLQITKIPTKIRPKLAPLKKIDKSDLSKKKDAPLQSERRLSREVIPLQDSSGSLSSDRASRDYTNLKFQDPRFYECPQILDEPTKLRRELDFKDLLKYADVDWEQLSNKFPINEDIIDIDRLSATTLAKSDKPERFDKEKHPSQLGQQKELTLTGGGSMFLKKNRSRDTTPSHDGAKLEDFRVHLVMDEMAAGERPKSILREKPLEDEERPEEERKSVRFDLTDVDDVLRFYPEETEDDNDSDSSNRSYEDPLKQRSGQFAWEEEDNCQRDAFDSSIDSARDNPKVAGSRFSVQNVSENEHLSQLTKNLSLSDQDADEEYSKKFENVKKIDLISKSDTECSITKSSEPEEVHRSRFVLEKLGRKTLHFLNGRPRDRERNDAAKREQNSLQSSLAKPKLEMSKSLDDANTRIYGDGEMNVGGLKEELAFKLEQTGKILEKNFLEQKRSLQESMAEKLEELRQELAEKEEQEVQKLITEMEATRSENLKKVRLELEVCYEKERQEILSNLKVELDERKKELLELRNQEMEKLANEHEKDLAEEKLFKLSEFQLNKQHMERVAELRKELEKDFEELRTELRMQQRQKITKITEDHEKCLAEILRDFRIDEGLARKMYKEQLEEIRANFSREIEKESRKQSSRVHQQDSIDFEKLRCEKRLLQDKYTELKEKYLKLKNDVRFAVEKRNKRKEAYAAMSETEKSASTRTRSERTESSDVNTPSKSSRSNSITNAKLSKDQSDQSEMTEALTEADCSDSQKALASYPKTTGSMKFESDDTTTTVSETNANVTKKKKILTKKAASTTQIPSGSNNNNVENPVENIRKQLEKLDEIGDQLPSNETPYRLRYPFTDKASMNASSELEFFRHRIHVERDSVRRAREALRQQKTVFLGRKRAWKQRSVRATLEQLVQEERELSDMEISLHRTRSLLGEKVIHLRHLEQSLDRVASAKKCDHDPGTMKSDEMTLSDMSSASSGFSSTDLGMETFADEPDHYQESNEIIASLENLNTVIREIWGVLNQHQEDSFTPSPSLKYSYLRWLRYQQLSSQPNTIQASFGTPNIQSNILSQITNTQPPTTTTQNIIAQYGPNSGFTTSVGTVDRTSSNLMERTRNLRDWLRQARVENTGLVSPNQATL